MLSMEPSTTTVNTIHLKAREIRLTSCYKSQVQQQLVLLTPEQVKEIRLTHCQQSQAQ